MVGKTYSKRLVKHTRRICVRIEQFGVFKIEFPARIICCEPTMISLCSPIAVQQRYVPQSVYAFTLKNILSGYRCKPLFGKELQDSIICQNGKYYREAIIAIIKEYKLKNNIDDQNAEYNIIFFEDPTKERKYEYEIEEYFTSV